MFLSQRNFFIFSIALILLPVYSMESSYNDILEYRLKNDQEFLIVENNAKIARNNYKTLKLNSFVFFTLSTGDMVFNTDKENGKFSINPTLALNFPYFNNIGLNISTPYAASYDGKNSSSGLSFGLTGNIYSRQLNELKLNLNEASYNLQSAERNFSKVKNIIEKKLLQDIKKIFLDYSFLLARRLDSAQADINYKRVSAQGYSKNSAKFRSAQLSLMSAQREEKDAEFSFKVSSKIFLESCGIQEPIENIEDFFLGIAKTIPNYQVVSMENLNRQNYKLIMDAEKQYDKMVMQHKINLNTFSASFNANMLFEKKQNTMPVTNEKTVSEFKSLKTGITMLFPGIKLYSGITVPITNMDKDKPDLNFVFSVNPISIYEYTLKKKNYELTRLNEKIRLDELKIKFTDEFKTFTVQCEKLKWQQKLHLEELEIYKQNAVDHSLWLKQGVISVSEKLQAELEYNQAVMRTANTNIDISLFNEKISELFIFESE